MSFSIFDSVLLMTLLVLYHLLFVGPRIRALRREVRGEAPGGPLALEGTGSKTEKRLLELEGSVRREIPKVGFVRFNAFDDVGGELSYALALLDGEGEGIVLSSIFSREETRTFGKRVRGFIADQDASQEERDAIGAARLGMKVAS